MSKKPKTQLPFKAKTMDARNEAGNLVEVETVAPAPVTFAHG